MVDIVQQILQQETKEEWAIEYKFHPTRRWRFDYACEKLKIAVEIEGNVFAYGRHNSPMGYIKDLEKYNTATAMGWSVIRFTPLTTKEPLSRFGTEDTLALLRKCCDNKKVLH